MENIVVTSKSGSSRGQHMRQMDSMGPEEELEEVVVEEAQDGAIEVDGDYDIKEKYGKYLPDNMVPEAYEEEEYMEEEIIDEDEILVDDDGMMEHEEVVYETMDHHGKRHQQMHSMRGHNAMAHGARAALLNERAGIDTLMTLSRTQVHGHKSVRDFLEDVGATEEVQSTHTQVRQNYKNIGNIRVQAPSRLLPVATMHKMGSGQGYVINKDQYQNRVRDWREEQRRDLEICDFFDSLPADRQIAYRKLLERLGDKVPKPIQGSRKYFRSTLAPHVKIPIPSNSKLELLSEQAEQRHNSHDGQADMYYMEDGKKVYMYNGQPMYDEKPCLGENSMVDVVAEEIVEEEVVGDDSYMMEKDQGEQQQQHAEDGASSHHRNNGQQQQSGDHSDAPAPLEPAFAPGDEREEPPQTQQGNGGENEEMMPILDKMFNQVPTTVPRGPVTVRIQAPAANARPLHERWFVVPELRKDLIGTTHVKVSRGSIEPQQHYYCESCHEYLPRALYEFHCRKVQKYGMCDYFAPRRFTCPEKGCNQKLSNIEKLCTHLRISHKLPLEIKEKEFDQEAEFTEFLKGLEAKGGNFRMSRGNKGTSDGVQVRYYRCNRNVRLQKPKRGQGHQQMQPDGNGMMNYSNNDDNEFEEMDDTYDYDMDEQMEKKATGVIDQNGTLVKRRNKPSKLCIDGVCTAFFKRMDFPDGRIHVRYCDYHLHSDAVLRLPDDVRERVKQLNVKRLPVPVIIKVIKSEIRDFAEEGTMLEDRILQINDKDVRNVLARSDMKPIKLHICRNRNLTLRPEQADSEYRDMQNAMEDHVVNVGDDGLISSTGSSSSSRPNLPVPPQPHLMHIDPEEIAREDEMLEMAINDPNHVDPDRPPSPECLTTLERQLFEEWQCEDMEFVNDSMRKRRDANTLRRRQQEALNKFLRRVELYQDELFPVLSHDQLDKWEALTDEMHEMYDESEEARKQYQTSRRRSKPLTVIASTSNTPVDTSAKKGRASTGTGNRSRSRKPAAQPPHRGRNFKLVKDEDQHIEVEEEEEEVPYLHPDGLEADEGSDREYSEELSVPGGDVSHMDGNRAVVDVEPVNPEELDKPGLVEQMRVQLEEADKAAREETTTETTSPPSSRRRTQSEKGTPVKRGVGRKRAATNNEEDSPTVEDAPVGEEPEQEAVLEEEEEETEDTPTRRTTRSRRGDEPVITESQPEPAAVEAEAVVETQQPSQSPRKRGRPAKGAGAKKAEVVEEDEREEGDEKKTVGTIEVAQEEGGEPAAKRRRSRPQTQHAYNLTPTVPTSTPAVSSRGRKVTKTRMLDL